MNIEVFNDKVYRKLHHILWDKVKPGPWILKLYPSYRHYKRTKMPKPIEQRNTIYLTQRPNKGAGIGHQMGNWNSGYYYSQYFGVNYAYAPFSNSSWDTFLGFGENEITIEDLKKQGYQFRKLPFFQEKKPETLELIQNIIDSYRGEKVLFFLELDQFYAAQYGAMEHIKKKFYCASSRKSEKLRYDSNKLNIAIHIRRGDIVIGQETNNPALTKRWVDNAYYASLIKDVVSCIPQGTKYEIYLFSQGVKDDFQELQQIDNLKFCFDMGAKESFLHMVYADILLTSKSSFSYKPALLSNGIKIVPDHFWHGYPKDDQWFVVDENGLLTNEQKEKLSAQINDMNWEL